MKSKILIVDDEPSIVDNIVYVLNKEGFQPLTCGTASEALRLFDDKNPDLIVLDVGLPDQSGFELAKAIREKSSIPIIFVTARSDEIDRVLGLEIGGDDYIVKPFSPRELAARVKAVLRRTASPSESDEVEVFEQGPFKIDESRYVISYHNEKLDLSRYEYRLLSMLIRKPGRVYTREQIMDLLWEEPEMSLLRTVDTHVKTIRNKLKAITPDSNPILTHRGIGYSLAEDL